MFISSSLFFLEHDINIDLSKSKQICGIVTRANKKEISSGGVRYRTFKRIFYFTLNNSNENFGIHRFYEGYEDLISDIKIGDTIKVYYRESSSDYNTHVFQVEKGERILESYKDYNKDASSKGGTMLFIGLTAVTISIVWYFNLLKLLTNWIEG